MNTLSYIMPKLAWIIPLVGMIFVGYVVIKNKQSDKMDAFIKENGVDVDAIMTEIVPDQAQRVNNKIVAVVSIKYTYQGKVINSKRGLNFYITDKEKFETGKPIRIRINPQNPTEFYYLDYITY